MADLALAGQAPPVVDWQRGILRGTLDVSPAPYAHIFPLREISAHPIGILDFAPKSETHLFRGRNMSRHAVRRHNCLAGLEKRLNSVA